MSESNTLSYGTTPEKGSSLVWVGGALGIGACVIGLLLFVSACFGFDAAFKLSVLPTLMGAVGFILVVVGAFSDAGKRMENVQVLAALVVPLWGLLGGLVLMAVQHNWVIFYK
jgi:hypothetical protein